MQFVTDGPDVPEELLQAHEECRVVFFCGAGISYPAGLPTFKGLVDEIYSRLGTTKLPIEESAYNDYRFDVTLGLLERRLPGRRTELHDALADSLKPKLRRRGATDTHQALLRLSSGKDEALRLVTTNFDRLFEHAARKNKTTHKNHVAPYLPVAKKSRWDGLVYLHGMLPKGCIAKNPETRLVVTSGDFGSAYLTERWAARFLSELFRDYIVCFIGYSIEDPVLRYMMDALAADKILGESVPNAYIFSSSKPDKKESDTAEWHARGIEPILYMVPEGDRSHSMLHDTLRVWSEMYRDGALGCERIVVDFAKTLPSSSTKQDDYVGRMLWALSHSSGKPARKFASFNPAPSIEWLKELSERRFYNADLRRFGVAAFDDSNDVSNFSMIDRPAPSSRASWMCIAPGYSSFTQWDLVMHHLARWLMRHLNDPFLFIWLANRGGSLNDQFAMDIASTLSEIARLQLTGNEAELAEYNLNSPSGVPSPIMRKLWQVMLSNRVFVNSPYWYSNSWENRLKSDGLSVALRLEFRELFKPMVSIREPYHLSDSDNDGVEHRSVQQLVNWEIVLNRDFNSLIHNEDGDSWLSALPSLFEDIEILLLDAMNLAEELDGANCWSDQSYLDLPSIDDHWQNRGYRKWVILIELLRDAWLSVHTQDQQKSKALALNWFDKPYPIFKRLAFFAALKHNDIGSEIWVSWLLADNANWLWSSQTKRERMRLLVEMGGTISGVTRASLEAALLHGPSRDRYREDLEEIRWAGIKDRSVWLQIEKLQYSGALLGAEANIELNRLREKYPEWEIQADESDEFAHWMSGTGDPGFALPGHVELVPRQRKDIALWLKEESSGIDPFDQDTWKETCRTRMFHSLGALYDLSQENIWPTKHWNEALSVWRDDDLLVRSWKFSGPIVESMPDAILTDIVDNLAGWLLEVSKTSTEHSDKLLSLFNRIIDLPIDSSAGITNGDGSPIDDPVMQAINHPIGHVTQAILYFWLKRDDPEDSDLLPVDLRDLLAKLCDVSIDRYSHGRVILASRLITLFRADTDWVETHLLPLFNWDAHPAEAKNVWEGFLWSPRIYLPLVNAMKAEIYMTSRHYSELGKHQSQYSALLTFVSLESMGDDVEGFRSAFSYLPQEGLNETARSLLQAIEASGENSEDYANNRILPFWKDIWPKNIDLISPEICDALVQLSIESGTAFPEIIEAVQHWLIPIMYPDHVTRCLAESNSCVLYPESALLLLSKIIDQAPVFVEEFTRCLDSIIGAMPDLSEDARYQQLRGMFLA